MPEATSVMHSDAARSGAIAIEPGVDLVLGNRIRVHVRSRL